MKKTLILGSGLIFLLILSHHADALCVKTSTANLRGGPGTRHEKTWEVYRYMPLKKIARKGNWYKVRDLDGDLHWVHRKLVTNKLKCAVVDVNKANMRTGPGTQFRKHRTSPAKKYESFKVLKIKGSWVRVEDEVGEIGWISKKLLWIQ